MPALPDAASWLLSLRDPADPRQRTPARWSDLELASLADISLDRTRAFLRRMVACGAAVEQGDGWYTAGRRASVAAWRAARGRQVEGGNSVAYKRAHGIREAIKARVEGRPGGAVPPPPLSDRGCLTSLKETQGDIRGLMSTDQDTKPASRGQGAAEEPQYIVREVARLLRCSEKTVKREIKRGNLEASRSGARKFLVSRAEILNYQQRQRVQLQQGVAK
jgi:excisionase family DNA binding protein